MDTPAGAGYAASWTTEGTSGEKTVTETEWLACTDPQPMLRFIEERVSERKLREVELCRTEHDAGLLHDIYGPLPFRSITVSPVVLTWSDGTVVRLAQAAYDECHLPEGTLDNGRLAILADALEEAGCTDADILSHLRGPGPHVRGCWAVDLCMGKS